MHAQIDNLIKLPQWFNEGAAEFFELSQVKKNRLNLPDKISYQWIDELKDYSQQNQLISLNKLIHVGIAEWNNEHYSNHYATSYAFIHYMVEADKKALRQFSALLNALSQGIDYPTAINKTFGTLDLEETEQRFHAWLLDKICRREVVRCCEVEKALLKACAEARTGFFLTA